MTFEEGERVRMNEPLFYINDDQYKARVEKAKAQLKKDEAQAAKAERDVQRLRPLYEQNAASQLDLDNAVAALDMARASVAMSKADLQQAELELSYTVVRSPLTGYISERYADIGSLVGKSNSTRLATVVKSDTVLVDFKLTALDYLRSQRRNVHLGELDTSRSWQPTVSVTLADNSAYGEKGIRSRFRVTAGRSPDRDFRGACRIAQSAPSVVTGTVYAGQVAARRAGKRNGGTQEGDFNREGRCVYFRRPARQYLLVEKRFIELGAEQGNRVVVDRGLSPDEKIVSEGYQKLKHGQHVTWTSDDRFTSEELRGDDGAGCESGSSDGRPENPGMQPHGSRQQGRLPRGLKPHKMPKLSRQGHPVLTKTNRR